MIYFYRDYPNEPEPKMISINNRMPLSGQEVMCQLVSMNLSDPIISELIPVRWYSHLGWVYFGDKYDYNTLNHYRVIKWEER